MKSVDPLGVTPEVMKQLAKGAFLVVEAKGQKNTMTIGWATIGIVWGKPIMTVLVRPSRHTFGLIEHAEDFSVSIPLVDMSKELAFCGSKSGRDFDKFRECNLECVPAQTVKSPVLKIPGIHYECTIAYKSAMDSAMLGQEYMSKYPKRDFHTVYYGEIRACYSTVDG